MILLTTSLEERAEPYVAALRAVGFHESEIAVVAPDGRSGLGELAGRVSGVLLSGGCDVDPARYGEAVLPDGQVEMLPERDELEWSALDLARERGLPVFGVCRGLQVINVYFGGSLWQDLPSQVGSKLPHEPADRTTPHAALLHEVRAVAGVSPLGDRLLSRGDDLGPVAVNSRHHQAVKALGRGLRPAAFAPDDLIEAFDLDGGGESAPGSWWLRAVQWHPENLIDLPDQRALWEDFAAAARRHGKEAP